MLASLNPIPFSDAQGSHGAPPRTAPPPAAPGGFPDFAAFFQSTPFPMWIHDAVTLRFLAVNDAAVARYGWSRSEFLAMTADRVRPAKDVSEFLAYLRKTQALPCGTNSVEKWRHITRSGEVLAVEAAWQSIEFNGHRAILATIVDRTGEQRIEEENDDLIGVLNLASDAIIICNLERDILFWNKGAERIYGWSVKEALGRKAHELFGMDDATMLACTNALLSKGEWDGEMQHARKDGSQAIVKSRWTLARDEATDQPSSVLLINSDITETKKLEAQFLRAQRLDSIGTLASGIAHDLNNILSPILMATGILKNSEMSFDDAKMLAIIEASAERGAGIVKQVLTFARGAEGERIILQPKHLITEMVKVMTQTFPKNIDIQTGIPKELWLVSGDATQLHQVLLNLCVNARDAMGEPGGQLRVFAENIVVDEHLARTNPGAQLGPHVCLGVTDTGSGMTPEVMDKIFDPFFTTKEQGKGTGLGLATVIGIVKSHNGFLTVQSKVGEGTTFRIFLPASVDAKQEESTGESTADLRGDGELVLVVDDETPVREAIVATLQANGYRCFTAEDGTDALALYFERREIAVVITDLHMGTMDGIALTRALRRLNPDVRVIVSSGHVDKEKQAILGGLGVEHILEKPYTAEKLLRSLRQILAPAAVLDA